MTKCLRMDAKNTIDLKYGTHTKCMTINSTWETELTKKKNLAYNIDNVNEGSGPCKIGNSHMI
jgi:hypothetical protein